MIDQSCFIGKKRKKEKGFCFRATNQYQYVIRKDTRKRPWDQPFKSYLARKRPWDHPFKSYLLS